MKPAVSVIIPTWKRGDLLRLCLRSLRQQSFADFEIVLVSNGAGEWVGNLAAEFGCTVLRFPENRGFAAVLNAGLSAVPSDYVAIVNDDVQLDRKWLEVTTALLAQSPDWSFCCGKIFQADGARLDNAGDALSLGGSAWRLGYGRRDSPEFDQPRPVLAVPGTAALFRRNVFNRLGGLEEDFFAYLEDMEFGLRAFRAGLRGVYLPQATAHHQGSATLGGPDSAPMLRLLTRNQLLLLAKHYPVALWLRLGPRIVWAQLLWALLAVRKRRLVAYLGGIVDFLRLLPRAVRKREPWQKDQWRLLLDWLRKSEREIYADVTATDRSGQDTFWRMYFLLFPPSRENKTAARPGLGRLPAR